MDDDNIRRSGGQMVLFVELLRKSKIISKLKV
jgi:hypothetical protein